MTGEIQEEVFQNERKLLQQATEDRNGIHQK
jgi:hypothetical protein